MRIKVLCNTRTTVILWCDADGLAYDKCTSPSDPDIVALNLEAWKGRPLSVVGPHADEVERLTEHLHHLGHCIAAETLVN